MSEQTIYNHLQLREIFHLEFLRWFGRRIKPSHYALKGGSNLRFFFNSIRYSEDMDIDVSGIRVDGVKNEAMKIFGASSFGDALRAFGVSRIVAPDRVKAKQAETTQRFKVHLLTVAGEDLFTKIEFSRRGMKEGVETDLVSDAVLRAYKMPSFPVPHYGLRAAILQKTQALAGRSSVQARDVFDLSMLGSQTTGRTQARTAAGPAVRGKATERVFSVSFGQFRDTVVPFLPPDDQAVYQKADVWDEMKLRVVRWLEEPENTHV